MSERIFLLGPFVAQNQMQLFLGEESKAKTMNSLDKVVPGWVKTALQ